MLELLLFIEFSEVFMSVFITVLIYIETGLLSYAKPGPKFEFINNYPSKLETNLPRFKIFGEELSILLLCWRAVKGRGVFDI